ncbi:MAG: NAD-dependent epimerase/dehydratase family protein [Bryobacteraceae bacterium]
MSSSYRQVKAVVTGGLGFIGSNLVLRLVERGARVTVIDSKVHCCGANEHNIHPVRDAVTLLARDIAEAPEFRKVLASADVVFNLAGEVSHVHSMQFPERDAELNSRAQLRFVQECARAAPGVRIVYAGTRQVYGVPQYLPVDEEHPVRPVDFNGVHKYNAMMYHLMFARGGALQSVVLQLTNVYGPRMALDTACQGVLSVFIRKLVLKQPLEVFGSGGQLRDPLYVDDAVEAFLLAGSAAKPASPVYNVGGPTALPLREIAAIALEEAGGPPPVFRPFPPERKAIDIGDYYADCRRIARELGWTPATPFRRGIASTLAYYRRELSRYFDSQKANGRCELLEPVAALEWRSAAR